VRIYVDAFFALNLVVDLVLLAVAGLLAGQRLRPRRLLLAAALGAAYALAAPLGAPEVLYGAAGMLAAAAAMLAVAYAPVPLRVLVRLLAFFYGAAALLGGLTALLAGRGGLGGAVPGWALAAGLGGCLLAGGAAWDRWRPEARAEWRCDLEVTLGGRTVACRALVDTGNALRDPVTRRPAVLVEAAVLRGLLPRPLLAGLAGDVADLPHALQEVSAAAEGERPALRWSRRLCVLPFRSVGGGGVLGGLWPDALRVRGPGGWHAVEAVVAVAPEALSGDGAYQALIPAALLAGRAPRQGVA
jgi:stage II sporulation protein GA (sporulation sigma-E factor processing peptidase)